MYNTESRFPKALLLKLQGPVSQKGLRPGVSLVQINKGLNSKNGLSCVLQKGGTLIGTTIEF